MKKILAWLFRFFDIPDEYYPCRCCCHHAEEHDVLCDCKHGDEGEEV